MDPAAGVRSYRRDLESIASSDPADVSTRGWMLLAPVDSFGEPSLLGEVLPEPHERAVQDLRDAALGQVEDPSDLPQRKAFVIVEGGNYPLLLTESLYGPNQPRANLGHLHSRSRVGRRVVPDEVVQPGGRASLVLQAGFERPHLRPRVLVEERSMLGDADPEAPDQLRLRRRTAKLLHELVPGTLDLVRPHTSPARQRIHLPQFVEYGPPNLGDRIRLELGAAIWIVGFDGVQEPEEPRRDDVLLIERSGHAPRDSAGDVFHERRVVDHEPVSQSPGLTFGHPALDAGHIRFGNAPADPQIVRPERAERAPRHGTALLTYDPTPSRLTNPFSSSRASAVSTSGISTPLRFATASTPLGSKPTPDITAASVSSRPEGRGWMSPDAPSATGTLCSRAMASTNSGMSHRSPAPSASSPFDPLHSRTPGGPGTAHTSRPASSAWRAVMRAPLCSGASTITTVPARPAMMRFLAGNRHARGASPR